MIATGLLGARTAVFAHDGELSGETVERMMLTMAQGDGIAIQPFA